MSVYVHTAYVCTRVVSVVLSLWWFELMCVWHVRFYFVVQCVHRCTNSRSHTHWRGIKNSFIWPHLRARCSMNSFQISFNGTTFASSMWNDSFYCGSHIDALPSKQFPLRKKWTEFTEVHCRKREEKCTGNDWSIVPWYSFRCVGQQVFTLKISYVPENTRSTARDCVKLLIIKHFVSRLLLFYMLFIQMQFSHFGSFYGLFI